MASATILVVDDDPDFVEIMRTILVSRGYRVITAANGAQALRQVAEAQPDLMILDIMMSTALDGYNVSETLAADPQSRFLPIIMVSSIAETPHAGLFPLEDRLHMDAWLSKPVNPGELLRKVEELLA
ncbi:MAG: response regulator [Anaerolineae bacterium]|uniref:response regulator n=1 Tax=Candidatus Amarolinea dominans TaxID=3140696 RepID=UPI001DB9AE34|nr:response regulator [Anaerolineae bacterium]MBK9231035.1 response regulator [Anaerolineae bacterium]